MKKLFLFALVATMFAACVTDEVRDVATEVTPETLIVSFEDADSRIQLQNGKTVWTKGDLVSVFYRSNANQKWQFQGATGDRTGNLKRVEMGTATETMNRVVAVYPYAENYYINPETYNIEASLPAEQTYLADSYGIGGNIMVSYGEYNQVVLKSVCGWLKVQLTGNGEKVKSIKLKGNNGEQVAGQIYINSADATAVLASDMGNAEEDGSAGGNLVFEDTVLTEVTLDCGEGVILGAEPTAFYIALPPQTFERGLTITIATADSTEMIKSTTNNIAIERNHIQPMAVFEYDGIPNNEIWYTTTDGTIIEPCATDVFGANILSNIYENGKGVIKFDGPVTKIGNKAFYAYESDREKITSITIPNTVITIGQYAFYSIDNLKMVNIPNSVTTIGYSAFVYCSKLEQVNFPNGLKSIGGCAFEGCDVLTVITIPDSVTSIDSTSFRRCDNIKEFRGKFAEDNGRCMIKDGELIAFAIDCGVNEYTIPDIVTKIGGWSISECKTLTSITIPDSVIEIEDHGIYDCKNLSNITIGNNVASIGDAAFAFSKISSITIPKSVTTFPGGNPFIGCYSLKEFKGKFASEDGRALIDKDTIIAYANASGTEYNIANDIVYIGDTAFQGCRNLASVNLPENLEIIGDHAFCFCDKLTNVTIPTNVSQIKIWAFYGCSSLKEVYCKSATPPTGASLMFNSNASGRKIYVPRESVEAYKAASRWSDYADAIEGYDF